MCEAISRVTEEPIFNSFVPPEDGDFFAKIDESYGCGSVKRAPRTTKEDFAGIRKRRGTKRRRTKVPKNILLIMGTRVKPHKIRRGHVSGDQSGYRIFEEANSTVYNLAFGD